LHDEDVGWEVSSGFGTLPPSAFTLAGLMITLRPVLN